MWNKTKILKAWIFVSYNLNPRFFTRACREGHRVHGRHKCKVAYPVLGLKVVYLDILGLLKDQFIILGVLRLGHGHLEGLLIWKKDCQTMSREIRSVKVINQIKYQLEGNQNTKPCLKCSQNHISARIFFNY